MDRIYWVTAGELWQKYAGKKMEALGNWPAEAQRAQGGMGVKNFFRVFFPVGTRDSSFTQGVAAVVLEREGLVIEGTGVIGFVETGGQGEAVGLFVHGNLDLCPFALEVAMGIGATGEGEGVAAFHAAVLEVNVEAVAGEGGAGGGQELEGDDWRIGLPGSGGADF